MKTVPHRKVSREGAKSAKGGMLPPVLDACCGPRMFWFDRADDRALFVDKRRETCHADTRQGRREIVVNPDMLADFKELPFDAGTFSLVVFDPPHTSAGPNSWTRKKYGTLTPDWRKEISAGFAECFRVLCPLGTLIFKWNEHRVPVSQVLSLTPEKPLFGQRCGTTARTHWIVFMKPSPTSPLRGKQSSDRGVAAASALPDNGENVCRVCGKAIEQVDGLWLHADDSGFHHAVPQFHPTQS